MSSSSSQTDLAALLAAADIHRHNVIRVTGPNGLPVLLWLCRHGYEQVGYLRLDHRGPHEPVDALLIAQTCEPASLAQLLAEGPAVAEAHVLIVQTHLALPATGNPYRRLLERAGYEELQCVHGRRRELHVARRHAAASPRKAA